MITTTEQFTFIYSKYNTVAQSCTDIVFAAFSCVQAMVYGRQCLGFWMGMHTLMYEIAHRGSSCTSTIRECTESWPWGENLLLHLGIKPASALYLAFWFDASWNELSYPLQLLFKPSTYIRPELIKFIVKRKYMGTQARPQFAFFFFRMFVSIAVDSHVFGGIFRAATSPSTWHRNPIAVTPALRATFHRSVSYRPSWSYCWN